MKYGKQRPRHRYEVQVSRRVSVPAYGPEAYYVDCDERVFGFGKGQTFSSGSEAKAAAEKFALAVAPQASAVLLMHCNGYGGIGRYIKESSVRFDLPLPDLAELVVTSLESEAGTNSPTTHTSLPQCSTSICRPMPQLHEGDES